VKCSDPFHVSRCVSFLTPNRWSCFLQSFTVVHSFLQRILSILYLTFLEFQRETPDMGHCINKFLSIHFGHRKISIFSSRKLYCCRVHAQTVPLPKERVHLHSVSIHPLLKLVNPIHISTSCIKKCSSFPLFLLYKELQVSCVTSVLPSVCPR
jgi:hypothetical protein